MTREEFMQKLEQLLRGLPQEERRDALDYYDEYFDAAGPEKEAETIAELGSPEEVARRIMEEQPQPPAPEDPNRQNTPLPPEAPAKQNTLRRGLCFAALAVAVVILCMYLFQHSSARRVAVSETSTSGTNTSAVGDSTTVPLEALKKLTLDLDAGSVVFQEEAGLTEATVTIQNKADRAELTTDYNTSGSTIRYKLPASQGGSGQDNFTVTITLPAGFEMETLDAGLDMGNLTLGDLNVQTLTADLDMGSVTAGTLRCTDADVELAMGSFTADRVEARKLTAHSDMGSVTIGSLTGEELKLSTDMGSLTAALTGSEQDYAIDAENDMGKLTIGGRSQKDTYHTSGRYSLTLRNSMGSTTIEFKG